MWLQFFLENIHFAINLFAALIFFAVGWLYFDAWLGRKTLKDGFKILGFFLLSLSFVVHATYVESGLISSSFLGSNLNILLVAAIRIPGYIFLIMGQLTDSLQPKPGARLFLPVVSASSLSHFAFPILATIVAFLYLRRATVGLENHLKTVSLAFYGIAIFELVSMTETLENTANVDLYNLVAPFGPFWIAQHVILVVSMSILGRWVYSYLLKRIQSQLFMIFTTSVLIIFLLTTVIFTGLLLKNLQDESLKRLETDAKVLNYAVDSKRGENVSDAQVLTQDVRVIGAVDTNDGGGRKFLSDTAQTFLLNKKKSILVIVSDTGQVLARGEDPERIGDSISDDPLIKRALLGETASSVVTRDGVLGPQVSIRSSAAIKSSDDKVIGAVMTGYTIDNAFMDGIKEATGLEAAVYGDNILSATTLLAADGKSRYIGVKEESKNVKEKVLRKGESFSGAVNLLNTPYFAAYLPLKDVDSNPVGMLFVGNPQVGVLQAAGRSIEMTFLVVVILLVLSVVPSYFISKYLTSQLR